MEFLDGLTNAEKERFTKTVNYLLNHTYVLKEVYENHDKVGKINADYRFIERFYDKYVKLLEILGYTVEKDDEEGIITINNRFDYNYLKLDKFTTLVLLTLRLIYIEEREKNNAKNAVFVSTSDLIVRMINENLVTKKPTIKENSAAIRTLMRHNILAKYDGSIEDNTATLVIYPTIAKLVARNCLSISSPSFCLSRLCFLNIACTLLFAFAVVTKLIHEGCTCCELDVRISTWSPLFST